MKPYQIYTEETAPTPTDKLLLSVEDMIGFVPNVFATMAESESALRAFIQLNMQFAKSTLNPTEREIIQTTVSVENQCSYCVAGHTAFANMQGVDPIIIEAVRNRSIIYNSKFEALRLFTIELIHSSGSIPQKSLESFLAIGYTPAQALEVILGVCVKTFSNLTNNLIGIPLDNEFSSYQ